MKSKDMEDELFALLPSILAGTVVSSDRALRGELQEDHFADLTWYMVFSDFLKEINTQVAPPRMPIN